jgi:hypothetical protein
MPLKLHSITADSRLSHNGSWSSLGSLGMDCAENNSSCGCCVVVCSGPHRKHPALQFLYSCVASVTMATSCHVKCKRLFLSNSCLCWFHDPGFGPSYHNTKPETTAFDMDHQYIKCVLCNIFYLEKYFSKTNKILKVYSVPFNRHIQQQEL